MTYPKRKTVLDYETYGENPSIKAEKASGIWFVSDAALPLISGFGAPGIKVWCYITANLAHEDDVITIDMKRCARFCNYSGTAAVYAGLSELLECGMIYRKTGRAASYFINQSYLYHGASN